MILDCWHGSLDARQEKGTSVMDDNDPDSCNDNAELGAMIYSSSRTSLVCSAASDIIMLTGHGGRRFRSRERIEVGGAGHEVGCQ